MTEPTQKTNRSFFLKVLVVAFLLVSWMGWMRLVESLTDWDLLTSLNIHPSPLYLAVSGAGWGALGLAAAVSLWFGWRWAPWAARLIALVSSAWYWIDRLALGVSPEHLTNVPFAALVNALAILFTFGVLWLTTRNERKQEESRD